MSAALVRNPNAPQTFVDDLESFLYVILWLALVYSPSSMSTPDLTSFINVVLDPKQYKGRGGNSKANFLIGRKDLEDLSFLERPLLPPLLDELAVLFAVRYERKPSAQEEDTLAELEQIGSQMVSQLPAWKYRERSQKLSSDPHTHVAQIIKVAVAQRDKWPAADHAKVQPLIQEGVVGRGGRVVGICQTGH